jgi:5-(carboxyamino)imidazole ribonucleotide synthase
MYMEGARTIGIVGGGQLGRMLVLAALPLGFRVVVVNPVPGSPAAQVGAEEIVGDLYDASVLQQMARRADCITVEIEHLDAEALNTIRGAGTDVHPAPQTIGLIQDKLHQKEFLRAAGIPVAPFVPIENLRDAEAARKQFGGKMIIKTRHGAYDGRGNMAVNTRADTQKALQRFAGKLLYAEQIIPFKKELAVMVARSTSGEVSTYPVAETVHERNICLEVRVPAAIKKAEESRAAQLAVQVAEALDGAGVFGIEMFLTAKGEVLVNEIAPRVHNSGHYTMDACRTSQFEQHIRAVTGLPLGATDLSAPAAVMINILGEREGSTEVAGLDEALKIPHVSVHLYGKSPTKVDRKMGHINATGQTIAEAQKKATQARKRITI